MFGKLFNQLLECRPVLGSTTTANNVIIAHLKYKSLAHLFVLINLNERAGIAYINAGKLWEVNKTNSSATVPHVNIAL